MDLGNSLPPNTIVVVQRLVVVLVRLGGVLEDTSDLVVARAGAIILRQVEKGRIDGTISPLTVEGGSGIDELGAEGNSHLLAELCGVISSVKVILTVHDRNLLLQEDIRDPLVGLSVGRIDDSLSRCHSRVYDLGRQHGLHHCGGSRNLTSGGLVRAAADQGRVAAASALDQVPAGCLHIRVRLSTVYAEFIVVVVDLVEGTLGACSEEWERVGRREEGKG